MLKQSHKYLYLFFFRLGNLYFATEFYGRFDINICLLYNKMTDFRLKSVLDFSFSLALNSVLVIYFRCCAFYEKAFDIAFVVLREWTIFWHDFPVKRHYGFVFESSRPTSCSLTLLLFSVYVFIVHSISIKFISANTIFHLVRLLLVFGNKHGT